MSYIVGLVLGIIAVLIKINHDINKENAKREVWFKDFHESSERQKEWRKGLGR